MTLDDMIRLAEDQARRVLIGTKEELAPMWMLRGLDGSVEIIATPWGGPEQKHLTVEAMRSVMRKRQIIAYSLLVEAWFAHAERDEVNADGTIKGPMPSQRPDRKECVCILAQDHYGARRNLHLEIIRDKSGRCAELRKMTGAEDVITGIFDDLLHTVGRPH